LRVAQGELHRRGSARRDAEHRRPLDLQRVEQAGMRVGLRRRRCIGRERRAQIAEARHQDDAQAAFHQRLDEIDALVEPAARAVHQEHRRPLPG
jgi:hypothetical protein